MKNINLAEFETHIQVRPIRMEDYDEIVELQLACFPGMKTWTREQIESQLAIFPPGQLCVEYDGEICASSSSLIVDFDQHEDWHDWGKISDHGFIRNHDPEGDTLYGIEIMVHPDVRGMKLARRLYDARKRLARDMNLKQILIGGRIPGYREHADEMTAREYVGKVMDKSLFDPVLTAQLANGFVLQRLIADYMPADGESRGYATFLQWTNIDHRPDPQRRIATIAPVRICVIQYRMRRISSFDDFAMQCRFFVDVASDYKSDFVLFPELFTTQLLSCVDARNPAEAARKLAEFTPRYLEMFTDLAVQFNVNVVGGSQFAVEDDDKLYNVAYLFRRNGTIAKQYKLHVTRNERRWWGVTPGDRIEVFPTDRGRVAIQICYDIEFPELSRYVAQKGANVIFVPFNTDERSGYLRVRYCAQARCIENHVFVAMAGCVGNLPFVDNADIHYAQSSILSPSDMSFSRDGVAAECTPNIETVVVHDVDVELLRRHRRGGTVQNWNDRRTDLYQIVFRSPDGSVKI